MKLWKYLFQTGLTKRLIFIAKNAVTPEIKTMINKTNEMVPVNEKLINFGNNVKYVYYKLPIIACESTK